MVRQSEFNSPDWDTFALLAHSKYCIQRSLEFIQEDRDHQQECEDLRVMVRYGLENQEAISLRFERLHASLVLSPLSRMRTKPGE
jgi:hypothetical protein